MQPFRRFKPQITTPQNLQYVTLKLCYELTEYWKDCGLVGCGPLLSDISGFGGLGVSVLASGTQVRGFKPGRRRRIFKGRKNPQHAFLRKGSKAVCPMSQICGM
jgi:hypothetical protein